MIFMFAAVVVAAALRARAGAGKERSLQAEGAERLFALLRVPFDVFT